MADERITRTEMTDGYHFIHCDIDGEGLRWRLAIVDSGEIEFDCDFEDHAANYANHRRFGPFTMRQMLEACRLAPYATRMISRRLPQNKPGVACVEAVDWNTMVQAVVQWEKACDAANVWASTDCGFMPLPESEIGHNGIMSPGGGQ